MVRFLSKRPPDANVVCQPPSKKPSTAAKQGKVSASKLQSLAAISFMQTVGNYSVELVMSLLSTHGRIQWSVISQEMLDADKFAILCK